MDVIVKVGDREVTVGTNVEGTDLNPNPYMFKFDENCTLWTSSRDYNQHYLKAQQDYANDLLRARGFMFLNDVHKLLGLPITKLGQIVGWVYDEKNPIGDNYVDLGIFDDCNDPEENVFILNPNVDGCILDKI